MGARNEMIERIKERDAAPSKPVEDEDGFVPAKQRSSRK
jgi:hypothetical protein